MFSLLTNDLKVKISYVSICNYIIIFSLTHMYKIETRSRTFTSINKKLATLGNKTLHSLNFPSYTMIYIRTIKCRYWQKIIEKVRHTYFSTGINLISIQFMRVRILNYVWIDVKTTKYIVQILWFWLSMNELNRLILISTHLFM